MFLDTSGLLALLFRAEPQHQAAAALYLGRQLRITHNIVIAELIALAEARNYPRTPILDFVTDLIQHPTIEIVWVDEHLTKEALVLLRARPDKSYSLCDAISFLLMHDHDVFEALTTDRHFEQEGFVRLLAA